MELAQHHYYHLYNRTNNKEKLFKEQKNYVYFLRKFRARFNNPLTVFAYCLMPTHFHFLVRIDSSNPNQLKTEIGTFLSAYTKAINSVYDRNGSLFQKHTKAKHIDDHSYLLTLLTYIHQNPVRARLVENLIDWPYASYLDLAGYRNGSLPNKALVENNFTSLQTFRTFSTKTIKTVKDQYWINN